MSAQKLKDFLDRHKTKYVTTSHPLARLRRFAAEQQEVTWSSRGVWSKRGKTQWVEETEPALVLMPVH